MSDEAKQSERRAVARKRRLIALYAGVTLLGFALGARGLPPFSLLPETSTSTPLRRVGYVLQTESPAASPRAWDTLRSDVRDVRAPLTGEELTLFDLVVALRGLNTAGNSEWATAASLCHALKWARCEQPALEALKARSKP